MRIAILSCFPPYRGGIAQFNSSLYRELEKEHSVRAFNFKRQYPEFLFPGKTQYVTEEGDLPPVESTAILDTINPFSWIRTAAAIRKWEPDILLLRYWMPWFAPSLGFVAGRVRGKCRTIAVLDNVIPHEHRFADSFLTKYFLKRIDGCITMCKEVADDLRKLKKDARFIIQPHPIYNNFGEKLNRAEAETLLGIPHGGRNLLFFGLIRDYKGLDVLIDAFGKLGPDYRLIIAGEPYGPFDKYTRQMETCPGKERIHLFTDYISDSEVKKFFSAADLCVLPYKSATQSGVSAISYHFEVPMVVTDTGGLKETVGDTGTGLLAASARPELIADKINLFFGDRSIQEGCITAIRKEKDRLSWKNFATSLINFAESLH